MAGFDDDHHAQGLERLLDAVFDLLRHTLLHLKAVGVDIDYAGYLRQSGDVAVRDVGHVGLAVEGQHVVLAEGEKVDILDDDHL